MRILFVGDIFGRPGRQVASEFIPKYIREHNIDFCVANGENSAGGFGITEGNMQKIFSYGVDVITSGNHIWDRHGTDMLLDEVPALLRPANYPPGVAGKGWIVAEARNGKRVGVINLQGRIFMPPIDCPFRTAERILDEIRSETNTVLIDFHAEASAEKMALGRYLDGRVTAVLGTHTHVMTADEMVFPKGTAYITDVGMTGPHDSIIGVKCEQSIARIIRQVPVKFSPASEGLQFSAVLIDCNDDTGRAESIKRIVEKKESE